MAACRTGVECVAGAAASGVKWLADVFVGTKEKAEKAVEFATDPFGFITHQLQDAVHAVAGVLIPWLLSALHPNYNAQWWLQSYAVSFSMSLFVLAIQLLVILSRRKKGSLGAKEALQSIFIAMPAFFIGASFGPAIGIALTKLFTAATDSVAQWSVNSSTQDFYTAIAKRAASGDALSLLGSQFVSQLVLAALFLSLLGVAFIFVLQLATQYLVGAVLPLGFVWIVNPDTRKLGKAVPITWLMIPATQIALVLLVGIAFRAINGIAITDDQGTLGNLLNPVQAFMNLAVPAVIMFIVVFAPLSMLKFIPRPGGGGGTARSSGFNVPQTAPQVPNSPSRAPQSPHQTASNTAGTPTGGGYRWNLPTGPASSVEPGGGFGYGGSKIGSSGISAAGKAAGSGGAGITTGAAGTAGKHAAGATAGKAGLVGASAGGGAAAVGATGVGAPIAVGMLLTNSALKIAQQASQAASQAADQAVEHGHHQEA